MRTIRIIANISLDGVIQSPGGPDEDGDYEYGGWTVPHFDAVVGESIEAAQGLDFDLLLGRRSYDIFAGYWPGAPDTAMADSLNSATKHVLTNRPDSLEWGPARALASDTPDALRKLKAEGDSDLIVWGSSTLTALLFDYGLVDEVMLLVYPVLLGTGKRFFTAGVPARELDLMSTRAAPTGVIINTYRTVGPLQAGSFDRPPV